MKKRGMPIAAVEAALRSPKIPAGLKRGLMKKYAKQLGGRVKSMSALTATMPVGEVWGRNPYPMEHAVRVESPRKFMRFRRQNDKFGPGVSAIWGVRPGRGDGGVDLQALRFSAKKFTPAKVRMWIDKHGGRGLGLKVEPATGVYKNCATKAEARKILGYKK
jgi:hypothetical protein